MIIENVCQLIVNGILSGGIYAVLSVGLTMIFGVMGIINFAHGEFIMLGMYFSYGLSYFLGFNDFVCLLLVIPFSFMFGVLIQKIIVNPILDAPELSQVFTTLGLGIVLRHLALILFKADIRSKPMISKSLYWGSIIIPYGRLRAFLIAAFVIGALAIFLKKSYLGKAIRATAQDRKVSEMMGVNIRRIYYIAFGIGSVLAAVAGALLLPIYSVNPYSGLQFVLICFVVVVLGGLGSIPGALVAGIIIGLVESFSGFFIAPGLKEVIYFIVFITVLLMRPKGFFGRI